MNEMSLMGSFARPWPFNELHNKNNTQPLPGLGMVMSQKWGMHCNIGSRGMGKGST